MKLYVKQELAYNVLMKWQMIVQKKTQKEILSASIEAIVSLT